MSTCPKFDGNRMNIGEGMSIDASDLKINIKKSKDLVYKLDIKSEKIKLDASFEFDYTSSPS